MWIHLQLYTCTCMSYMTPCIKPLFSAKDCFRKGVKLSPSLIDIDLFQNLTHSNQSWPRTFPKLWWVIQTQAAENLMLSNPRQCLYFVPRHCYIPVWQLNTCLYLSRLMTKPTMWLCAQRRLRSAQSDQSSLSAWRKLGSLSTHWAYSEDSDQTGRIPRLIWVFAGRTATFLVLSRGGSFYMSI